MIACVHITMEHLKDDTILKFRTDTLEAVRKDVNLEKMGRIEESIDVLEKWVQMQPHFVKKDFRKYFLHMILCFRNLYLFCLSFNQRFKYTVKSGTILATPLIHIFDY